MLQKCKAVVLKTTKYSESSLIVNCYTDVFGKISFIISGIRTRKAKNKIALFQILSLLELTVYYKEKREIQRIKEVHVSLPLVTIAGDVIKSSVSFFLAELMFKALREYESNLELYNFIENSVKTLDLLADKKQISNFHLAFLVQLSKYIGFLPTPNYSQQNSYFDLQKGIFVNSGQVQALTLDNGLSKNLFYLIKNGYNAKLEISRVQRNSLLTNLITYYNLHLETNLKIKSLEILAEIFNPNS